MLVSELYQSVLIFENETVKGKEEICNLDFFRLTAQKIVVF